MGVELTYIPEPDLMFGFEQSVDDPRDGLTLFGPLDKGKPLGIRTGVVGTDRGIGLFTRWLTHMARPILPDEALVHRPLFPGFEEAFRCRLIDEPSLSAKVVDSELTKRLYDGDKYRRVYGVVDLFADPIPKLQSSEEAAVDIWFIVIPDIVYKYCRPESHVESDIRVTTRPSMSPRLARELQVNPSLFESDHQNATPYLFDVNFHNQLKARLLSHRAITQIVKESTLATIVGDIDSADSGLTRMRPQMAWNISTTTFYKAGGRPWKLAAVRDGVCYLGLVFKQDNTRADPRYACCAAQMFLDSGDGLVFRGALGPWYNPETRAFHLGADAAHDLVKMVVRAYSTLRGHPPKEIVIHGKTRYSREEWEGFLSGAGDKTNVVGIRILEHTPFRAYRPGRNAILRGLSFIESDLSSYVWTKGFIPRLQTYPGLEVPGPIYIDLCCGLSSIETITKDILALTKLNYNACLYGDGIPVTLRFADAIGEILTAGPLDDTPPLPFKHYI